MRHAQLGRNLTNFSAADASRRNICCSTTSVFSVACACLSIAISRWMANRFEALQRVHYASFAVVQQQFIEPVLCYVSSSLDPAHHGAARTDRESQLRFMLVA